MLIRRGNVEQQCDDLHVESAICAKFRNGRERAGRLDGTGRSCNFEGSHRRGDRANGN